MAPMHLPKVGWAWFILISYYINLFADEAKLEENNTGGRLERITKQTWIHCTPYIPDYKAIGCIRRPQFLREKIWF